MKHKLEFWKNKNIFYYDSFYKQYINYSIFYNQNNLTYHYGTFGVNSSVEWFMENERPRNGFSWQRKITSWSKVIESYYHNDKQVKNIIYNHDYTTIERFDDET